MNTESNIVTCRVVGNIIIRLDENVKFHTLSISEEIWRSS